MKRIALVCFVLGFFYPNILWGLNIKEVPLYCKSIINSLGRGKLKPGEITQVAKLETLFSKFSTTDYDPIKLARGSSLFRRKGLQSFLKFINGLKNLSS